MKSVTWQKNAVSAAVSAALCTMVIAPAFAQTEEMEEVVVTGIRGSLTASMDIKRNATGVVDAISAEDIGKFPDTNLAESLQRITGVSIDRVNGEGGAITVRGFGPGFNLVTLNGRQLPAAHVGTVTGNDSTIGATGTTRSFDFSNLASEGVSGLEVYKTGNASVPTGGIGATINIKTVRPLEGGSRATIGAKAVYDEGGDNEITPEVSGLVSWANDSETFGISAFATYQERKGGNRSISVAQYDFFNFDPDADFFANATLVNAPAEGALMALPANMGMNNSTLDRKRLNGMLTLQFAAGENTMITADALYTSNELDQRNLVPGIWFSRAFNYVEFDGSTIVATPIKMTETPALPGGRGKDLFFASYDDRTKDESTTFGLNVNHKLNDAWSLDFDAATSTSESGGNGVNGANDWRMNVAAAGAGWQGAFYGNGVPTATIGVLENTNPAQGNGNGILDIPDVSTQTAISQYSTQETDTDQFNLSAAWDETEGVSVKFGVGYMTNEMSQRQHGTQDFLGGWGVGSDTVNGGSDIPDPSLVEQFNVESQFNDLNFSGYPDATQIPAGYVVTNLGQQAFQVDPYPFLQAMESNPLYPNFSLDNLTQNGFQNNDVEEEIFSAYAQAKFDGEIAGLQTQTVVGLRYEKTKVEASAQQNTVAYYTWLSDNDWRPTFGTDLVPLAEDGEYANWLPNIDFSVQVTDSIKARASVSQTIARPAYNNLFMTTATNTPGTLTMLGGTAGATRGNPSLEPLESFNLDVSLEWYYSDSSYASVGFFRKAVNNFVGTGVTQTPLFGLLDPTSGAPGSLSAAARDALGAQGFAASEQNMYTMAVILSNPADFPGGAADYIDPTETGGAQFALDMIRDYDIAPSGCTPIDGNPGGGPTGSVTVSCGTGADAPFNFNLAQPVNNQTAVIDGLELAWQHFFGDTGFGFQANATIVNGDVGYDLSGDPTVSQFALEGLADSANAVLIYEKYGFSARVAYNWRDAFLQTTVNGTQQGRPIFVDTHEQIDFNLTYTFNDSFSVGLDGINVTGEGIVTYSRTKQMQWLNAEGDPRYMLSARYNFR